MTTNHPTAAEKSPAPASLAVVNRLGRLLLVGAIGFGAWYTWTVYSDLLHGPRPVAAAAATAPPSPLPLPPLHLLAPLPADGPWQFNGAPWTLQIGAAAKDQAAAWLAREIQPCIPEGDQPQEWEKTLIHLAELAGSSAPSIDGSKRYAVDRQGMQAVLWTQVVCGKERVTGGRLALPQSAEEWRVVEIRPAPAARSAPNAAGTLLPLPADAKRAAHRQDDRGEVIAEIVALDGRLSRVIQQWRTQGWTVEELTGADGKLRGLACRAGDRSVQVWANESETAGPLLLLVVAVPNGSASR